MVVQSGVTMKPTALTDTDLTDLEQRLVRGWVIRRDQIQSLIAMARERNEAVRMVQDAAVNQERGHR